MGPGKLVVSSWIWSSRVRKKLARCVGEKLWSNLMLQMVRSKMLVETKL